MHRRRKYRYFTKIDISMQYYTFMLDDKSAQYVVIVTPFGKWGRVRVPMGFIGSTDWAQAVMEEIFQDVIQDVECYIDDIGIFDTD
jgi:putative transposon-encoded protein